MYAALDRFGLLFEVESGKEDGVYAALGRGVGFMRVAFWEDVSAAQDEVLETAIEVVVKDVCHVDRVWTVGRQSHKSADEGVVVLLHSADH